MSVNRLTLTQSTGELTPIAQRFNRTVACTQAYYIAHKNDPKSTSPFPEGCFIVVKDDTQSVMDGFVNQMYPAGSIYMNGLVNTDPNVLFGTGTWTKIEGKFLYGATTSLDDLGDTGGATTVTLTQNNLPAAATFTIPSLSLSIDATSTDHTHSGTTDANNRGHTHTIGDALAEPTCVFGVTETQIQIFTAVKYGGTEQIFKHSHTCSDESQDHTHTFTTGNMSTNATHTHTGSTVSASKTIEDFGSGTAFDILPPYQKVNIWMRVS